MNEFNAIFRPGEMEFEATITPVTRAQVIGEITRILAQRRIDVVPSKSGTFLRFAGQVITKTEAKNIASTMDLVLTKLGLKCKFTFDFDAADISTVEDEVTATGEVDPIPEIGDEFSALKRAARVIPGVRQELLAVIGQAVLNGGPSAES